MLCNILDLVSDDITEYGTVAGVVSAILRLNCHCIDGHEGSLALIQLMQNQPNSLPGVNIHATGTDYIGDIFKLTADKSSSSDFTFMKIVANDEDLLSIRGDGLLSIAQLDVTTMEQQFQRAY